MCEREREGESVCVCVWACVAGQRSAQTDNREGEVRWDRRVDVACPLALTDRRRPPPRQDDGADEGEAATASAHELGEGGRS